MFSYEACTNSSSMVPALLMSIAHYCCANISNGAKRFIKEFINKKWPLMSSVKQLLTKSNKTGSVDRKPGSGKNVQHGYLSTLIHLRSW